MLKTSSNSVRHDAPSREQVLSAAGEWVRALLARRGEIVRVGYFGSYARGDYAPGSDFDVLIEVTRTSATGRADRASEYLPGCFPVDLDVLVYTSEELTKLREAKAALIAAIDPDLLPLP